MRDTPKGFSLIELLIVVAVIAILAAVAVPSLQSSKKAANEAAAIAHVRSWTTAQEIYLQKFGAYADSEQQLIDEELIGTPDPDTLGYSYSIGNPSGSTINWWGNARPQDPGVSGDRYFFVDVSGVIRWATGGDADASSSPLGTTP